MSRIDPLSIALSGIANTNRNLAVLSQNIANANTQGYIHESHQQTAADANGLPFGVRSGITVRDLDTAVQTQLLLQNAATGQDSTRANALARIGQVQGKPGAGVDITTLLGQLRDSFSTLLTDPSSSPQQQSVLDQADRLTTQLHLTTDSLTQERQTAQDRAVADIGALNTGLAHIGALSRQIIQLRAVGGSTANLENQRDSAAQDASKLLALKCMPQPTGDIAVLTDNGLQLPTDGSAGLTISATTLGSASFYPGGGAPAVTLHGQDVTVSLNSGSIGAALALRDTTLPTYQGTLDEFAQTLATRFSSQGLTLFTDPQGTVPSPAPTGPRQAPYVGFAGTITVNPAVRAQPSLVRDGTQSIPAGSGPTAFTPNPSGGPAGFTTMITRVISYALSGSIAPSVAQPAPSLSAMGPTGLLVSPIAAPAALADFATALLASQAADATDASNTATASSDTQKALQQSLSQSSGVNMDTELAQMVQLQNAYAANARVITTMQSLWAQLLQTVQ